MFSNPFYNRKSPSLNIGTKGKVLILDLLLEVDVRETRHIKGLYTLTADDARNGRKFDDVVSRGYFPMDIHNPDGATGYTKGRQSGSWVDLKDTYDIPFHCLIPQKIKGLVLSGRCISGTRRRMAPIGGLAIPRRSKKAREEAHALECLRAYMKNRKKHIASQELMDKYMKQK